MELRQYFAIIRKYWWLILLTTALAGSVAFYFSFTAPQVYRATTTLEINRAQDPLSDPFSGSNARTAESTANVFSAKIESPLFLQKVKDRLDLERDIGDMISVQQVQNTQFLRISAESNDRALSQALADTAAQVFIEEETTQQQARFQKGLDELESKIQALEASIAETQMEIASLGAPEDTDSELARLERTRLESQLNRDQTRLIALLSSAEEFRLAMARYTDYISIQVPAKMATSAVGPQTMQNTLLGTATGLMIGVSIAFLLEYLDDTIRSPEDVKRTLPVGILGALPRLKKTNGQRPLIVAENSFQPVAEAFRSLRTSIQFSAVDHPVQTLLVTSPLPTDGKTFIAANLAAVLAQGGQDVILVDTDLRHPVQHRVFGLPKEPGLTTALLSPQEQIRTLRQTDVDGLRIVTSGSRAPNPAELLGSDRFDEFISWLTEQADVVVFDSPPVLAVTDAVVLSNLTDGTVMVVDCGETRRAAALQAVERLANVGGHVLGVVLNRLAPSGDGYYYYYYHDYYYGDGRGHGREQSHWITRLLKPGRRRDEKATK